MSQVVGQTEHRRAGRAWGGMETSSGFTSVSLWQFPEAHHAKMNIDGVGTHGIPGCEKSCLVEMTVMLSGHDIHRLLDLEVREKLRRPKTC